jgi:hypothetical protein
MLRNKPEYSTERINILAKVGKERKGMTFLIMEDEYYRPLFSS